MVRAHRDWNTRKLHVTEFGVAYGDGPADDGQIRDERRIRYIDQHLRSLHRAIEDGIPVAGAFVWSFLDNFEWSFGYSKRFGLVWVDYDSLERTIKASGRWYGRVAMRNALEEVT